MRGITLSKEYGVNPLVETCTICGKEMSGISKTIGYAERGLYL